MNWLKYLVGFSALIIAGCAAYFSVTGLGVLFSAAAVSVMVMAGALEFAKLVAATYLKQEWDNIKGFNKDARRFVETNVNILRFGARIKLIIKSLIIIKIGKKY